MNKKMLKVVLVITIACFFHVASYATGKDLLKSNIPQIYGKSKGQSEGSSDLTIIHIQDAHGNVEAQENIQSIIKTLVEQGKVDAISDEGAWWEYNMDGFNAVSDEDASLVADYWTKYALMGGAARYKALNDRKLPVMGLENKDLKLKNQELGQKSHANKKESLAMAKKIKGAMEALKLKIYDDETRGFLQALEDFGADKITLTSYAKTLQAEADKANVKWNTYNNFNKVVESIQLEDKIDFAKIDRERLDMIDELETKVDKKVSDEIVTKSLNYRLGRLSAADYYNFLLEKSLSAKIDMSKYENVNQYAKLVNIYAEINDDALFAETDRLEAEVKGKIFKTDAQVNFDKHFQNLEVLTKMIGLEMTRADLAFYNENKPSATKAIAFLQKSAKDLGLGIEVSDTLGKIDQNLASNVKFYEVAMKRDEVMVENTLAMMDERGFKTVVLVAGGFHTEGIIKALKAKTVSHMIITPRITNPDAPNYHMQNYLGEETEATKMLKEIIANTDETESKNTTVVTAELVKAVNVAIQAEDKDALSKLMSEHRESINANLGLKSTLQDALKGNTQAQAIVQAFVDKGFKAENIVFQSLKDNDNPYVFMDKDGKNFAASLRDGEKDITKAIITLPIGMINMNNAVEHAAQIATSEKNEIDSNKSAIESNIKNNIKKEGLNQRLLMLQTLQSKGVDAKMIPAMVAAAEKQANNPDFIDKIFEGLKDASPIIANLAKQISDNKITSKNMYEVDLTDEKGAVTRLNLLEYIAGVALGKETKNTVYKTTNFDVISKTDKTGLFSIVQGPTINEALQIEDYDIAAAQMNDDKEAAKANGRGMFVVLENGNEDNMNKIKEMGGITTEDMEFADIENAFNNGIPIYTNHSDIKRLLKTTVNADKISVTGDTNFLKEIGKNLKGIKQIKVSANGRNFIGAYVGLAYSVLTDSSGAKAVSFVQTSNFFSDQAKKGAEAKNFTKLEINQPDASPKMKAYLDAMNSAILLVVAA